MKYHLSSSVSFRYIVKDVDAAIDFYRLLGFHVVMHPAPEFAILSLSGSNLYLSKPSGRGGGGQAMPDGRVPEPGGWNRISVQVEDLTSLVEKLKESGCKFRNEIVTGVGGKQILVEDPSGNAVELFQPTKQQP